MEYSTDEPLNEHNPKIARRVYNYCGLALILYFALQWLSNFLISYSLENLLPFNENIVLYQTLSLVATLFINVVPFYLCYLKIKPYITNNNNKTREKVSYNFVLGSMCVVMTANFISGIIVQQIQSVLDNYNVAFESPGIKLSDDAYTNIILFILIVIVAPITEEFIFRSVLFKGFSSFGGVNFAIIVTSIFFSILHGNIVQAVPAFVIGLIFGYVRSKSKTVIPCIILHGINNLISFIALITLKYLPDVDLESLTENLTNFETLNLMIIGLINYILLAFILTCFICTIIILVKKYIRLEKSTILNKAYGFSFVFSCWAFDAALIINVLILVFSINFN